MANKTTVGFVLPWSTAFSLLIVCACPGSGGDWHQFNGPNRDNISVEKGLLSKWPEAGPELVWAKSGIGEGYSSVAVLNGTIYTAGKRDSDMIVVALHLNGERKWKAGNGPAWNGSVRGTRSTPTVVDSHVYVLSGNGRLACLQAADGSEVWAVDIKERFDGKHGSWGYSESLLVDRGKVICTPGGSKAVMVALDTNTGEEEWRTTGLDHAAGYAAPVAITHGEKRIVLGMTEKSLVGVDAKDGRLLWRIEHFNEHGINAQTPLYHDGHVLISSGWDCGSVLFKLGNDGTAISERWRNKEFDNDFGGILFVNGYFYGFSWLNNERGQLMCVDFETGETVYAHSTSDRQRKGAITWADGMLYCYDEGGEVWVGAADSRHFEILSRFKLPMGGGQHWAHPVVSGGRLYIRHGDFLHAYKVKAE